MPGAKWDAESTTLPWTPRGLSRRGPPWAFRPGALCEAVCLGATCLQHTLSQRAYSRQENKFWVAVSHRGQHSCSCLGIWKQKSSHSVSKTLINPWICRNVSYATYSLDLDRERGAFAGSEVADCLRVLQQQLRLFYLGHSSHFYHSLSGGKMHIPWLLPLKPVFMYSCVPPGMVMLLCGRGSHLAKLKPCAQQTLHRPPPGHHRPPSESGSGGLM